MWMYWFGFESFRPFLPTIFIAVPKSSALVSK